MWSIVLVVLMFIPDVIDAACDPASCGLFPDALCRKNIWRYKGGNIHDACSVDGMAIINRNYIFFALDLLQN